MKKNTIHFDFDTVVFTVDIHEIDRTMASGKNTGIIDTLTIDDISKEIISGKVRYHYSGYNKKRNYIRACHVFSTRKEAVEFIKIRIQEGINKLNKLIKTIK